MSEPTGTAPPQGPPADPGTTDRPMTPPGGIQRGALDRALLGGLAWTATGRWLSQIFRWAATLGTARLLLPSDFGIVGMATVIVGLLQYVAEFGFGAAIVQQRSLSDDEVRQIGGASLLISLGMAVLVVLLAPAASIFFKQPALTAVLPVLAVRFLIDALAMVPRSVLARDLEFRKLSIFESAESIAMAGLTIGLAWSTRSYWSLILGVLGGGIVFSLLSYRSVPLAPRIPRSVAAVRAHLRFGSNVVLARLAWYSYANSDFAVVGRVMSDTVLGVYTLAWNVASVPAEKLAGLVLRVAPSVLAAANEKAGEMRRYYLLLVRGVALVTFPLAAGLALVSNDLVAALLGAKWMGAVGALRYLAVFFGIRAIASLAPVVMVASGNPQVDRNYSFAYLLVLPPLFLWSSRWGIDAVAATWLIAYPVLFSVLGQRWVLRTLEVSVRSFIGQLWPAASSVAVMSAAVLAAGRLMGPLPAIVRLGLLSMVGGAVYFGALALWHRETVVAVRRVVQQRSRQAP